MQKERNPSNGSSDAWRTVTAVSVCILSLAIFFREFLWSNFNLIAGDAGDNRFIITILEHWRAVAQGQAQFRSPNFFWPQQGVLGYSEALFLFSFPYALFRAAGADSYLAFELELLFLKIIGFCATVWLLRLFGVSRSAALIGASLFTISNLYYLSEALGHAQLCTVVLLPLLASIAVSACQARKRSQYLLSHVHAASFGLLFALLLFTSFYIGWFGFLVVLAIAFIGFVAYAIKVWSLSLTSTWLRFVFSMRWPLVTCFVCFVIGMLPFFQTYLPIVRQTGGRSYLENLGYAYHPIEILDIGAKNWVWGSLLNKVMAAIGHHRMVPSESEVGWPPVTLSLVLAATVWGFWRGLDQQSAGSDQDKRQFLAGVFGLSFICCWLLAANFNGWSLWWFVFKFFPGGSAIRVPSRIAIVLNVVAVLAICLLLDGLGRRRNVWIWLASCCLGTFVLLEQINTEQNHSIQRHAENALWSRLRRPPEVCRSFFLRRPASPDRIFVFNQIDAMLVGRMYNLPTVNGYSGWFPHGWNFLTFDQNYTPNLRHWVWEMHISEGLCGLDLQTGTWNAVDLPPETLTAPQIDFRTGGNASPFEGEGWGRPERGGTWEIGSYSNLRLKLPSSPKAHYMMTLTAHAFAPKERPAFDVEVHANSVKVAVWHITKSDRLVEQAEIPLSTIRSGTVEIEFLNGDPRSPAEFGLSTDDRKLGLAFETLSLTPATGRK